MLTREEQVLEIKSLLEIQGKSSAFVAACETEMDSWTDERIRQTLISMRACKQNHDPRYANHINDDRISQNLVEEE